MVVVLLLLRSRHVGGCALAIVGSSAAVYHGTQRERHWLLVMNQATSAGIMLAFLLLPGLAAAAPVEAAPAAASLPMMPLKYRFGGYNPKISADIRLGEPAQDVIETVVDLGSTSFWVYGPDATVFYGSKRQGEEGSCSETAKPSFDDSESSSATTPDYNSRRYSYGSHFKTITAHYSVNDTLSFANPAYAPMRNTRVELANETTLHYRARACSGAKYERSILGLGDFSAAIRGPNLRRDLLERGVVPSSALSLWFDAPPAGDVRATFRGSAVFGGVPSRAKYAGPLVSVQLGESSNDSLYWVAAPSLSVTAPSSNGKAKQNLAYDRSATRTCLLDSGTGSDKLPLTAKALYAAIPGLMTHRGHPTFNGPCAAMPKNLTLDYVFASAGTSSKSVTVRVPLRNYARGVADFGSGEEGSLCALSLSLGSAEKCVLGAPFFSAAFLAVNHEEGEKQEIALAQGGVSTGAEEGTIGRVRVVERGEGLPVDF